MKSCASGFKHAQLAWRRRGVGVSNFPRKDRTGSELNPHHSNTSLHQSLFVLTQPAVTVVVAKKHFRLTCNSRFNDVVARTRSAHTPAFARRYRLHDGGRSRSGCKSSWKIRDPHQKSVSGIVGAQPPYRGQLAHSMAKGHEDDSRLLSAAAECSKFNTAALRHSVPSCDIECPRSGNSRIAASRRFASD